jgi:MFS superfamily sulfate permease-like transporter
VTNKKKELLAYGAGNLLSSIFKGLPATAGLTRTRIVETSGAKTQMFSLISSIFVLVVILDVGYLLKDLPYVSRRFVLWPSNTSKVNKNEIN